MNRSDKPGLRLGLRSLRSTVVTANDYALSQLFKISTLMVCQCHLLSESASGRIVLYGYTACDDTHNIALQFNNITQWLCYEDFLALEWNVRGIDIKAYFEAHPHEERVHLSTPSRYLSFSFRPNELVELKQMLGRAIARLHWIESLRNAQN